MEMLSGGFYKATIHRVIQPPADQRGCTRLGLFYFGLANDDVRLLPVAQSPVLQRVGITRKIADEDAPTQEEYRIARTLSSATPCHRSSALTRPPPAFCLLAFLCRQKSSALALRSRERASGRASERASGWSIGQLVGWADKQVCVRAEVHAHC